MIVVGIIGILVSVSGPMYSKYQAKARQSEAKIGLAAVYSLEKSFYSEYAAYIAGMDAIGYTPEGSRRFYYIGWQNPSNAGDVSGFSAASGVSYFTPINNGGMAPGCSLAALPPGIPAPGTVDSQTFVVYSVGSIRYSGGCDSWYIDNLKTLQNAYNGT